MKRFFIAVAAVGVLGLAAFYALFCYGFYIDFHPNAPVNADFTVEGTKIAGQGGEVFRIKGVEISASMPEHAASEFAPEKEDYLRWFALIQEMGANTVKAAGIMDDDFYEAIYEFNSDSDEPLYLLQGILLQDAVNYGAGDAYEQDFMGALIEDGKRIVDIIHGNRLVTGTVPGRGSGWYTKDISRWVIGFLVGSEWNGDTVAYTDHESAHSGVYEGEYFFTTEDASSFEAVLARIMDEMTAYESSKYKMQHLIGFSNSPETDPLEYADDYDELQERYERAEAEGVTYARQLNKICQIDAEHIRTTEKVKAGYFAAYSLYDFCDEFYRYLSDRQKSEAGDILAAVDVEGSYDGYPDFLSRYHTIPVVCTSYGFSSARGAVSEKQLPLTEEEQGERLAGLYEELCELGWSGAVINSWQDRWELKSWNTAYAQDFTNNFQWHDMQTEAQSCGLMEFVSEGRTADGDAQEWEEEDIVYEGDGMRLSAYADAEGLSLLVEGDSITGNSTLYIPIDTTEKSGTRTAEELGLEFSREADFLICISGSEDSRILVHPRYESVRANFLMETSGEDPYNEIPDANEDGFVPVYMAMQNRVMVKYVDYNNREQKYLPLYETGKLRHGNADPESEEYDSLADFCYGEKCVEIRIPWALLNFANPAEMLIHGDYYENYGVDFMKTDSCYLGVAGAGEEEIQMRRFDLKPKEFTYEERLKKSYEIVQEAWR